MRRSPPAVALVFCAIVSVQSGAALAKNLFAEVGPAGATVLRLLAGTVVLLAIWRPRLPSADRGLFLAYGAALGCMNLSFYAALSRVPLGAAVTVEFLGPLGVALFGSRRRRDVAPALLAAVGIVLLARGAAGSLDVAGLALAALAGLCWACYILLSAAVGSRHTGGAPVALAMVVASAVVLPFGALDATRADLHTVLIGCAVGVLSSVIPYSLELEALRRLPARVFGVLMSLEPAVAALFGWLVLSETLTVRQLAGISCVVAASAAATLSARTAPAEPAP